MAKLTEDLEHVLGHSAQAFGELAGKTVFLTGGTGFFGKWFLETFLYANNILASGIRVIVLSRNPAKFLSDCPQFSNKNIIFVSGDIRDFKYPGEPIDFIIHAASELNGTVNIENPLAVYDTIVEGTRRVLELAKLKKVKSVLHTSSGAVYGRQPHDITHIYEDYTGAPDVFDRATSYGEGKRVAEMMSNIYHTKFGVPSKIARCFAFVGPYMPLEENFAIGNFIRDVTKGQKIIVQGDGTPFRSYMYASDLVIWLLHILMYGKDCRPYNVGSDLSVSVGELAKLVAAHSKSGNTDIEIKLPKSDQPAARYVPSIKRAKEELYLEVHIGLEEAIGKTLEFYSK